MTENALVECPFCACTDIKPFIGYDRHTGDPQDNELVCDNCGAQGPSQNPRTRKDRPRIRWNDRPAVVARDAEVASLRAHISKLELVTESATLERGTAEKKAQVYEELLYRAARAIFDFGEHGHGMLLDEIGKAMGLDLWHSFREDAQNEAESER
jgi:hypothetical protein